MLRKQGRAHLPRRLVEAVICLEGGHDSITEAWKIAHDSNRTPGHELRQTCTNCFSKLSQSDSFSENGVSAVYCT